MHDANAGRNELKGFEGLLAPFQKLIAFPVALEFHLQIQSQRVGRSEKVYLHAVIDDEIDRHERLDNFGIATNAFYCAAHRSQIDHQWHASEILQNNSR